MTKIARTSMSFVRLLLLLAVLLYSSAAAAVAGAFDYEGEGPTTASGKLSGDSWNDEANENEVENRYLSSCDGPVIECKKDYEVVATAGGPSIPSVFSKIVSICPPVISSDVGQNPVVEIQSVEKVSQYPTRATHKGTIAVTVTATDVSGKTGRCTTRVQVLPCGDGTTSCSVCRGGTCRKKPVTTVCRNADLVCGSVYPACCPGLTCRKTSGGGIDQLTGEPRRKCRGERCLWRQKRCDNKPNQECCGNLVCRKPFPKTWRIKKCLPRRKN